jgi:hypothetical protein
VTQDQIATYRAALKEARQSFKAASIKLHKNEMESNGLKLDISKLRRTITALAAMCSEQPNIDALGITDSVSEVMESTQWGMSTNDVVLALQSMGFDLDRQKNAAASVHAVLARLAGKGVITKVTDESSQTTKWRGPKYDPDTEGIPF